MLSNLNITFTYVNRDKTSILGNHNACYLESGTKGQWIPQGEFRVRQINSTSFLQQFCKTSPWPCQIGLMFNSFPFNQRFLCEL